MNRTPQDPTTMADRLARLVVGAPDPDLAVAATPGWSVTDAFGHVAMEASSVPLPGPSAR
ncbi:hypothetical protein [Streptomyces sp. NPDC059909]|uniref:hypothetical protein n=1 Tax=Streptomyces sp. NPDC059909 TaxID=3346998 RepID=UPI00364F78C0